MKKFKFCLTNIGLTKTRLAQFCVGALITITITVLPGASRADVAVIVHPDNPIGSITETYISRIFLGKTESFPDKGKATPIEHKEGSSLKKAFHTGVTRKNPNQLNAYWSRLIFTGKGTPPKVVRNDKKVKSLVSSNTDYIGYIDSANVDGSIKVVFTVAN